MKKLMFLLAMLPAISYCQDSTAIGFKDDTQDIPAKENAMFLRDLPTIRHPYKYHNPSLKEYAPSAALTFLSGIADGLRDASLFYHIKNGSYWDGRNSWQNKYKNGDYKQGAAYFGSTSVLAWTTDGPHLSSTVTHISDAWAFVLQPNDENRCFGHLALKAGAIIALRAAGHFIMYDVVIKNQNR